jgi:hypothetical protein
VLVLEATDGHSILQSVAYQGIFRGGGVSIPGIFFGAGLTNSVEDRRQRERGSGGGSPLVKGSTQFANE